MFVNSTNVQLIAIKTHQNVQLIDWQYQKILKYQRKTGDSFLSPVLIALNTFPVVFIL